MSLIGKLMFLVVILCLTGKLQLKRFKAALEIKEKIFVSHIKTISYAQVLGDANILLLFITYRNIICFIEFRQIVK